MTEIFQKRFSYFKIDLTKFNLYFKLPGNSKDQFFL